MTNSHPTVAVLCGGVGAARFLRGLRQILPDRNISAVINTADDLVLHGLSISPDLDTCVYTIADEINPETGWGLAGESWQARDLLDRYGGQTWFALGDRDLGTHLYRSQRLAEGAALTQVTAEIAAAWGIELSLLPMTEDRVRTRITLETGETIDFQRYFVERQHADPVAAVDIVGALDAAPTPEVLDALAGCDIIVIAPSNPILSIDPILALPGIRDLLRRRRHSVVAISPIVGAKAVKGPAAEVLRTLGHEVSAAGVAAMYSDIASAIVIDDVDADLAVRCAEIGVEATVTNTMMTSPEIAARLARVTIDSISQRE